MRHLILILALLAFPAAVAAAPNPTDATMFVETMPLPEYHGCVELRLRVDRGGGEVECVMASCVLPNSPLTVPVVTLLFCDPVKKAR